MNEYYERDMDQMIDNSKRHIGSKNICKQISIFKYEIKGFMALCLNLHYFYQNYKK